MIEDGRLLGSGARQLVVVEPANVSLELGPVEGGVAAVGAGDEVTGAMLLLHVGVEHEALGVGLLAVGALEGPLDPVDEAQVSHQPVNVDEAFAAVVADAVALLPRRPAAARSHPSQKGRTLVAYASADSSHSSSSLI
jgi:hypothetical protein